MLPKWLVDLGILTRFFFLGSPSLFRPLHCYWRAYVCLGWAGTRVDCIKTAQRPPQRECSPACCCHSSRYTITDSVWVSRIPRLKPRLATHHKQRISLCLTAKSASHPRLPSPSCRRCARVSIYITTFHLTFIAQIPLPPHLVYLSKRGFRLALVPCKLV
ncbi:hypothetical protein BDZ97DRAFT_207232 [Flammula alnicola]|nr:hypothetical protein BDZ97DRAFT_207232 [Flammula alnicola]